MPPALVLISQPGARAVGLTPSRGCSIPVGSASCCFPLAAGPLPGAARGPVLAPSKVGTAPRLLSPKQCLLEAQRLCTAVIQGKGMTESRPLAAGSCRGSVSHSQGPCLDWMHRPQNIRPKITGSASARGVWGVRVSVGPAAAPCSQPACPSGAAVAEPPAPSSSFPPPLLLAVTTLRCFTMPLFSLFQAHRSGLSGWRSKNLRLSVLGVVLGTTS